MAVSETEICFFDPHFHIWTPENKVQDPSIFEKLGDGVWTIKNQVDSFAQVKNVKITGGVFVEAISHNENVILEAAWVHTQMKNETKDFWQCPKVDFSQSEAYVDLCLRTMTHLYPATSIRHILNYEPSWPKNLEDYLFNETWKKNYKMLEKYGLSFDAQLNPHQFASTLPLFESTPNIKVIVNHLGTLKDVNNEVEMRQWREGMIAWSKLPNIYVKISMLCYIDSKNWNTKNGPVHNLVKEVLTLFGAKRCMFASNYPVDKFTDNVSPETLINAWEMFSEGLSEEDKEWLYEKTARSVYTK